jgi:arylsulfatase A-like enzyme
MIKPVVYDTLNGESLRYGWKAVINKANSENYGTFYWKGTEQVENENLDGDDSRIILDRVIPFIEKSVEKNQPFFSAIWIHTPHLPVVADQEAMADYSPYSHQEQIYYAAISAMDKQVGRLWKKLKELNVTENTMIWFCSDNGPEQDTPGSAGPFRERKRSLYEGGVRVPAFCIWPGTIKGGQVTDFPAFTSDYLPTIIDLLNVDYPSERPIDGISLTEILEGKEKERAKPMGFQFQGKMSWVTQKYKLISIDKGKTFELYNLLSDKGETENIINENLELADKMKSELMAWVESCEMSNKGNDYK